MEIPGQEARNKARRIACDQLPGDNKDCTCHPQIQAEIGTKSKLTYREVCKIEPIKPFDNQS